MQLTSDSDTAKLYLENTVAIHQNGLFSFVLSILNVKKIYVHIYLLLLNLLNSFMLRHEKVHHLDYLDRIRLGFEGSRLVN